jgi:hypothetical protein
LIAWVLPVQARLPTAIILDPATASRAGFAPRQAEPGGCIATMRQSDYYPQQGTTAAPYSRVGGIMAVDFRGHPMFATTGFDAPPRFEADICDRAIRGKVPSDIEGNVNFRARYVKTARLPNHSHISEACAVGTADESLTGPILKFIEAPPK